MKFMNTYFERVEDNIQLNCVLSANEVVYFTCISEWDEDKY